MPSGIELIGRGLEMAVAASPAAGGVVEEAAAAWGMQVLALAKRRAAAEPRNTQARRHEGARGGNISGQKRDLLTREGQKAAVGSGVPKETRNKVVTRPRAFTLPTL